jgi:hypothetical protein
MNPYVGLGLLVLLAISHGWAYVTGGKHKDNEWKAAQLVIEQKARATEQMWQGVVNETDKNWKARAAGIQRTLDTALDSLRSRPGRLPDTARTDCAGATGRELSEPDAAVLVRLAARADRHRSALQACYEYADKLK